MLASVGGCKPYENRPEGRTKADLHVIQVSLDVIAHTKHDDFNPSDYESLHDYLKENRFLIDDETPGLRDHWQTAYRLNWSRDGHSRIIEVSSAGADRRFDTDDDLTVKVPFPLTTDK